MLALALSSQTRSHQSMVISPGLSRTIEAMPLYIISCRPRPRLRIPPQAHVCEAFFSSSVAATRSCRTAIGVFKRIHSLPSL
jgi:hypothetical protein